MNLHRFLTAAAALELAAMTLPWNASAHDVADEMAEAAGQFLASLDDGQKAKATFPLDGEERKDWHFIPRDRNGLPLKEMRQDQQHLAYSLLNSAMSHTGYTKALTIMSLEQVLHELENQSPRRDPAMYFFSIFGEPGPGKSWGWRMEGHHLSLNFTIAEGKLVAGTPNFFAANPGQIQEGPRKGLRLLEDEEDVARALVKSLDGDQQKKAIILDKAPKEILTEAQPKVSPLGNEGIPASELTDDQKKQLRQVIDLYVNRLRPELAADDWKEIEEAGFDNIVFAWAGGLEMGEGHYYRVQGPTFLLEYVNTQNGAYHPHSAWRDFDGDFGEDLLRKHVAEYHRGE